MLLRVCCGVLAILFGQSYAQVPSIPVDLITQHVAQPHIAQWLLRLHQSSQQQSYVGTFEVTAGQAKSAARIWHVCEGTQQIERVDALSGIPRTTFRRNDQVMTYFPEDRVVVAEKRASLGIFTNLINRADVSIARFYQLQASEGELVAGLRADVVELLPRDHWRFSYRVWTEQTSGLVLKLQTLDSEKRVLEQAAFSDLQLAQPLSWGKLNAMMGNTAGFVVKQTELISTTADKEGWRLKSMVPGFKTMSCVKRQDHVKGIKASPLQWVLSDGLASVSLFIEPYDAARHAQQSHDQMAFGATHMQTRRLGHWWLTVVGEVPQHTLQMLAQSLERKK
nr:MucB/RseB C-terminal domain-containing protein [uncultured Rhodoferax sp.]